MKRAKRSGDDNRSSSSSSIKSKPELAAGLVFPREALGSHLSPSGQTIDHIARAKNMQSIGSSVAEIWSQSTLDDFPVMARFVVGNEGMPDYPTTLDRNFHLRHVRTSRYFIQIIKCSDNHCCKACRTHYNKVFPARFIPAPIRYTNGMRGKIDSDVLCKALGCKSIRATESILALEPAPGVQLRHQPNCTEPIPSRMVRSDRLHVSKVSTRIYYSVRSTKTLVHRQ